VKQKVDEKEKIFEDRFDEEEISLREIFEVLKKRARIIAAITVISVLASAAITFFVIKPVFESNTTIMVGKPKNRIMDPNNPITYQEVQTNRLLVSTYGEIAKSRSVLEEVIKSMNLAMTSDELRDKVDVSLVKDTEIIQIKVQDHDPAIAANLANAIAAAFSKQVIRIMNVENVQVVDEAIPGTNPVKPRPVLNIAISLVLGLMVGLFLAFVLEFFDTSIKTPEDVAKYLGLPVIGSIPYTEEGKA
jgi:capsular polysaccharide biosynthesis protein